MDEPLPDLPVITEGDLSRYRDLGIDVSAFTPQSALNRPGYREVTEDDKRVSWGDYGRALGSGAAGIVSGIGAIGEYTTDGKSGGKLRRQFSDIADDLQAGMGPAARRAMSAAFLPGEGEASVFENATSSLGLKSVAALPSLITAILPGGLVASATRSVLSAGARAAVAGGVARTSAGLMNAGDLAGEIYSGIEKISDDELQTKSPVYAGYRSLMNEQDARRRFMSDVVGAAPVVAFAITSLTGGIEGQVGKRLGGEAAKGFLRGAATGAAGEAVQESMESGGNEALRQLTMLQNGLLGEADYRKLISKSIEGAAIGGVMGGAVGGVSNIGKKTDLPNIPNVLPVGPDPAQQAALGAVPLGQPAPTVQGNTTQPSTQPPKGTGSGVPAQPANVPTGNPSQPEGSATEYPKGNEPIPTVPEGRQALEEQQQKLINGDVPAMLFPWTEPPKKGAAGKADELALPEGFDRISTREGVIHFDPKAMNRQSILDAVNNGRVNEVLGYVQSKEDVARAAAQGDGPVVSVVERGPTGTERRAAATSPSQEMNQIEGFKKQAAPDSTISVETPGETLARRVDPVPPNLPEAMANDAASRQERLRQIAQSVREQYGTGEPARPIDPEQEYWDEYDQLRAERAAGIEPEVEAQAGWYLTPEERGEVAKGKTPKAAKVVAKAKSKAKKEAVPAVAAPAPEPAAPASKPQVQKAPKRKAAKIEPKVEAAPEPAPIAAPAPATPEPAAPAPAKSAKVKAVKEKVAKRAKKAVKEEAQPEQKVEPKAPAPVSEPKKTGEGIGKVELSAVLKRFQKNNEERASKGRHGNRAEKEAIAALDKFGQEAVKRQPEADEAKAAKREPRKLEVQKDLLQGEQAALAAAQTAEQKRTSKELKQALERRLQKIVDDAKAAGLNVEDRSEANPQGLQTKVFPQTPDGVLYLRVVKDMLGLLKQRRTSDLIDQAMDQFIAEDIAARNGDFSLMRARRLAEGDERNRRSQGDVEAISGTTASPEDIMEINERNFRKEQALQEIDRLLDGLASGEIKKITADDIARIREIAGRAADDINMDAIREALTAEPEKPQRPKPTSKGKEEAKPEAKDEKPAPRERPKLSPEEQARYAAMLGQAAEKGKLSDVELKRDASLKAEAEQFLKENDPTYRAFEEKGSDVAPKAAAPVAEKLTPAVRKARMVAATNELPKLQAQATSLAKRLAEAQGAERKALDIELDRKQKEIAALQRRIENDERILNGSAAAQPEAATLFVGDMTAAERIEALQQKVARELLTRMRGEFERTLLNDAVADNRETRKMWSEAIRDELVNERRFFEVNGQDYVRTSVTDADGKQVYTPPVPVIESMPLSQVMEHLAADEFDGPYTNLTKAVLQRKAADTPVRFVSDADMRVIRPNAAGFFDGVADQIVLPERFMIWSQSAPEDIANFFGVEAAAVEQWDFNHTVLHEGAHAALRHQLEQDRVAVGQLHAIGRELLAQMGRKDANYERKYLFASAQEFLAEAMGSGAIQRDMKETRVTRGLAKALGLDPNTDMSLWQAFLMKVADWLGMGDGLKSNIDALDAVFSVVDRLERVDGKPSRFPALPEGWSKQLAPNGFLPNANAGMTVPWTLRRSAGADNLGQDLLPTRDSLTDRGNGIKRWLSEVASKATTLDQLRQLTRGLFTDQNGDIFERVVASIQKVAPYAKGKKEAADQLAARFINFTKSNPKEAAALAETAIDATMSNVRLSPGGDNKHLEKGWRGWQGQANLKRLQAAYANMSPEARQLYDDMAEFYRGVQNEITQGIVNNILDESGVEIKDRAGLVRRIMNDEMSQSDAELFEDKPTILKGLKDARELKRLDGDYFPLMRQGEHVVVTEDDIKDTMGGVEIEPGKVEFRAPSLKKAMAAAEAFSKASPLRTTNVRRSPDDSTSTDYGVVVTVQKKGMFSFESRREAFEWRRLHAAEFDRVSEVQPRRNTGIDPQDLTTSQFNSLIGAINRQDASAEVKALMRSVVEQAAARMMSGNRVQQRSITRRNVMGASRDFGRNLTQYGQAAGGYLAKIKYMPAIREGMKAMRKIADETMAIDAPKRVQALNELSARINEGVIDVKDPPKFLQDLMTLTFLGKLFSPMYSVINGMQPWMVTYPVLAGRYGTARAASALGGAYQALGFTEAVGGGIRNTWLAGKQFNAAGLLDTTDLVGSIKKNLGKESDGAELNQLIDMALERGAMSAGGFEIGQALSEGRNRWGQTLSKVDRIARQLPEAVENVNRAVTLVAAYRLARTAMGHEKAMSYAFDQVMNTQGDYSGANAPRFFANPWLRPALQFKKYAQMMSFLLADMVHKSFKGATPMERKAARVALLHILGVQIATAGALSLPGIEIAKMAFMVAAAMGFGDGWDDQEEKLRKFADETLGKGLGEAVMKGFTRAGGYGVDVSQRLSLSDMWTFGEPRSYNKEGLQSYLAQLLLGAPGGTAIDAINGFQDVGKGDVLKGLGKIVPVKFAADFAKAANGYREGKTTAIETGMNTFGVRSARQAETGREQGVKSREREDLQRRYKTLSDQYLKAKSAGERAVIKAKINEHNRTAPLRYKVFPGALDKVSDRIAAERVN